MREVQLFLIALGGNLPSEAGPPEQTLRLALDEIARRGGKIDAVSRFYHTPCFPAGMGPDYVNAAARIGVAGEAGACLELLHEVEAVFGRERTERWGGRTLDLDLLAAGNAVRPDRETYRSWLALPEDQRIKHTPDQLVLPHPRMQERAFVLVPLCDIAPEWVHPVLGGTVAKMLSELEKKDIDAVRAL